MGLSYLHFQQAEKLVAAKKPAGRLLLLETDPVPLHVEHLRRLVAESKDALAAILDTQPSLLNRVRASVEPVANVTPDILVEAGKRLEVVEVMAERPRGLSRARRFDKALGTDRLQSDQVREALEGVGFDGLKARTSLVTLVAPDFTPAQQSAALRLGFKLRQMLLAAEEGTGELYFVVGSSKDPFPTESHPSVEARKDLARTIAEEVRRFLAATEWEVPEPVDSVVRAELPLPGRSDPVSLLVRPLIAVAGKTEDGLLVEVGIKDGTKAVDPRRIELAWGENMPERSDGYRFWRTTVSLDGGPEHAIPRLLFPVREIHDAVEGARVA